MTTIDLRLPTDLLASLTHAAAFTLTDPQALAAFLVKGALGPYRREIDALAARAGVAWLKASPFIRYAAFLEKPGSAFRVHDRTIRHEDWKPIVDEIGAIKAALGRYGWPRDRIDRFIRRAGEHAQLDATRAAKNKSK